jgi:hypothetical protein
MMLYFLLNSDHPLDLTDSKPEDLLGHLSLQPPLACFNRKRLVRSILERPLQDPRLLDPELLLLLELQEHLNSLFISNNHKVLLERRLLLELRLLMARISFKKRLI